MSQRDRMVKFYTARFSCMPLAMLRGLARERGIDYTELSSEDLAATLARDESDAMIARFERSG